jgi:hypothetical protein
LWLAICSPIERNPSRQSTAESAANRLRTVAERAPSVPIHAPLSPIFFAALAPEASFGMVPLTAINDASSGERAAPHSVLPARSDDKIFAAEAHSPRVSNAANSVAAVQTSGLFIARSELGAARTLVHVGEVSRAFVRERGGGSASDRPIAR